MSAVINLAERRAALLATQVDNLAEAFLLTLEQALTDATNDIDGANEDGRPTEEFLDACIKIVERVREGK